MSPSLALGRGAVSSDTSHSSERASWEPAPGTAPLPRGRAVLAGSDPDDTATAGAWVDVQQMNI